MLRASRTGMRSRGLVLLLMMEMRAWLECSGAGDVGHACGPHIVIAVLADHSRRLCNDFAFRTFLATPQETQFQPCLCLPTMAKHCTLDEQETY